LLNLANNHTGDFGIEGRNNTVKVIEEAGLLYAGLLSKPYTILEKNGLKYGFCGFAPNSGTCDLRDIPEAQRIVKLLEETCNVVIVSIHGGAEGSRAQNVTRQTEWYVGENRGNIYEIAHKLVDAGADIIFAHGPHVPRAVEIYNNRLIAYSLGNFCTYSRMNIKGVLGYAPILKVWVQNDGQFLNGEIISAIQIEKQGTPTMGGLIIILATIIPVLLFADITNIYVILLLTAMIWMGLIGFVDDYLKKFRKNKEGLKGIFKIIGQVGLGLIVGLTVYFHPQITIKQEKIFPKHYKVQKLSEILEVSLLEMHARPHSKNSLLRAIAYLGRYLSNSKN